jgi:hypothetical protein
MKPTRSHGSAVLPVISEKQLLDVRTKHQDCKKLVRGGRGMLQPSYWTHAMLRVLLFVLDHAERSKASGGDAGGSVRKPPCLKAEAEGSTKLRNRRR